MYYELYVDSLFLVNFVMNLYLLILVDRTTLRTATRSKMVQGAAAGAILYPFLFLLRAPGWLKWIAALSAGAALMLGIAFRPRSLRAFAKLFGHLLWYSFLMGGLLLAADCALPVLRKFTGTVFGVLGIGAIGFLLTGFFQEQQKRRLEESSCIAVLSRGGVSVRTRALMDSGNSLREPISGKPVSVIDGELYHTLWGEEKALYRVVPYQSIGKTRGILKAYLLPGLELEIDGMTKRLQDVYVAVSEEKTQAGMILNPEILKHRREDEQRKLN